VYLEDQGTLSLDESLADFDEVDQGRWHSHRRLCVLLGTNIHRVLPGLAALSPAWMDIGTEVKLDRVNKTGGTSRVHIISGPRSVVDADSREKAESSGTRNQLTNGMN